MAQQRASPAVGERGLALLAVVLSGVAGYVDAVGYLALAHVYVANMSGNTIAVGRGLAEHSVGEAVARVWPIVTFTLGLFLSELAYELLRRRGRPSAAGWTLALEAGALALAMALPFSVAHAKYGAAYYVPTGLFAFAMGLQNATLIRVGASGIYTTHVTGNLTRMAREGAQALLGQARRPADERRATHRAALMAVVWFGYLIGAVVGTIAGAAWARFATMPAVCVLFVLVTIDAWRPIGGHEAPPLPHPIF